MSVIRKLVLNDPAGWEDRKQRIKQLIPLPDSSIARISLAAGRLHQLYVEDFVFIHINKTGGTALERALGIPLKNHDLAVERRAAIGKRRWNTRFKFAVVRNPYERMASTFAYVHRSNPFPAEEAVWRYEAWLERVHARYRQGLHDRNEGDQVSWVADADGRIMLNRLYRYERLSEDIPDIERKIGRPLVLRTINQTRLKLDYAAIYTRASREIVNEMHARDFDILKYDRVEG